uniref:HDC15811 n=1 Tax=Drosophila melanogaster TaxID=7227 RepID=Q6IJ59_DROME|nr:TPA_inf: HDC15811 [Drosophila melanogaster]
MNRKHQAKPQQHGKEQQQQIKINFNQASSSSSKSWMDGMQRLVIAKAPTADAASAAAASVAATSAVAVAAAASPLITGVLDGQVFQCSLVYPDILGASHPAGYGTALHF